MSLSISKSIRDFFSKGHQRTLKAKRHILISLLTKGGSLVIGFLLVPLTIGYVNEEQYGIWLTLASVIAWFEFFDFGLGNGLRNRFAEAKATGNYDLAKIYVSSSFAIISIVSMVLLAIFAMVNPFLDWSAILNTSPSLRLELSTLAMVVFSFFCLSFILKLLYMIFTADQKPSYSGVYNLIINIIVLAVIYILTKTTTGSLLYLGIVLGLAPIVVLLFANIFYFRNDYKDFAPALKYVRKEHFSDLMSLGFQFFFIQMSVMVMFSTDNMIIAQLFSPKEVVPYNIAYRYFGLILQMFSIICMPFWSAYTEAYVKKEMNWIKTTSNNLLKIWFFVALGGFGMLMIAKQFYALWVPGIEVPFMLSFYMWLYIMIHALGSIYMSFINGVSKLRLQLIVSIIAGAINIPLSIFFARDMGMGTGGVIFATFVCLLFYYSIMIIQFRKIINGTATGIWDK